MSLKIAIGGVYHLESTNREKKVTIWFCNQKVIKIYPLKDISYLGIADENVIRRINKETKL